MRTAKVRGGGSILELNMGVEKRDERTRMTTMIPKPELTGLFEAAVDFDRQRGGQGRLVAPLLRIAVTDWRVFVGVGSARSMEILSNTLMQLVEVRSTRQDYLDRNVVRQVLDWAAGLPEGRGGN